MATGERDLGQLASDALSTAVGLSVLALRAARIAESDLRGRLSRTLPGVVPGVVPDVVPGALVGLVRRGAERLGSRLSRP